MSAESKSKSSKSRQRLSKLLREGGELFSVEKAANILDIDNHEAAKALARWQSQGWLNRIKRGTYVSVPIEAEGTGQMLEDAWVLVPELFEPAYIGGWSAAEHWDLTEQMFKDICIFTSRPVAKRSQIFQNISFVVNHIPQKNQFGIKPVWRKEKKILVSDPERTIIDMLSDPRAGGGIQHVVDCLSEYINSGKLNEDLLLEYAVKFGNGAVFKRLGFLAAQMLGEDHPLTIGCKGHLSAGNAKLDPAQKGDKLITKWRLFIPANLQIEGVNK